MTSVPEPHIGSRNSRRRCALLRPAGAQQDAGGEVLAQRRLARLRRDSRADAGPRPTDRWTPRPWDHSHAHARAPPAARVRCPAGGRWHRATGRRCASLRRSAPKRVCVISGCLPVKSQASVRAGIDVRTPVDGAHRLVERRVARRIELRHEQEYTAGRRATPGRRDRPPTAVPRTPRPARVRAHRRRRARAIPRASRSPKPRGLDAT